MYSKGQRDQKRSKITTVSSHRASEVGRDFQKFISSFTERRFLELAEAAKVSKRSGSSSGKKVRLKLPVSQLLGWGQNSERALQAAFGWYWEPLLHDLVFFEEMRDAVSLIDGSVQKLADLAMDGFKLQVDDEKSAVDLDKALIKDQNVNLRESIRRSMIDIYTLGNCYAKPEMWRDAKGRLVPKVIRPIRANALRKLRDDTLATEGYVQLLHRPSEFILGGTPHTPTIYTYDELICGIMRSYGWYAYGKPLLASLPFVLRLKLQMERDLAEMLHQHLPRIDIKFTPDEQMNQEQVDESIAGVKADVAAMRPTDNFVHTPDIEIDYKGPQGHTLDFAMPQKHIEEQLFYVLPFAPGIMGLDTRGNPYDSQQHWVMTTMTAKAVRSAIETMFAPMFAQIAEDWGIPVPTIGWNELDPERASTFAEAEEYTVNNAVLKRDNGFIDQDTAARQATAHHPEGPVKKAAAPGKLPPPADPNKAGVGDGGAPPSNRGGKVRKMGPKGDGTKVPDKDKRPKGQRHSAAFDPVAQEALDELDSLYAS